jgi:hypothetical protein
MEARNEAEFEFGLGDGMPSSSGENDLEASSCGNCGGRTAFTTHGIRISWEKRGRASHPTTTHACDDSEEEKDKMSAMMFA